MDDRTLYLSLVCVVVMASLGESGTLAGLWPRSGLWRCHTQCGPGRPVVGETASPGI
jgi:hypothetical protein